MGCALEECKRKALIRLVTQGIYSVLMWSKQCFSAQWQRMQACPLAQRGTFWHLMCNFLCVVFVHHSRGLRDHGFMILAICSFTSVVNWVFQITVLSRHELQEASSAQLNFYLEIFILLLLWLNFGSLTIWWCYCVKLYTPYLTGNARCYVTMSFEAGFWWLATGLPYGFIIWWSDSYMWHTNLALISGRQVCNSCTIWITIKWLQNVQHPFSVCTTNHQAMWPWTAVSTSPETNLSHTKEEEWVLCIWSWTPFRI